MLSPAIVIVPPPVNPIIPMLPILISNSTRHGVDVNWPPINFADWVLWGLLGACVLMLLYLIFKLITEW